MGFYKVLKEKAGANIKIKNLRKSPNSGELIGSIIAKNSSLRAINCPKELIPSLIDELPIFFVIAALTKGISKFRSIEDLKNKESNRILESQKILIQAGIKYKSTKNSITIYGKDKIEAQNKSIIVKTKGDHRICLSSVILALVTGIRTKIKNFETVNTSFPGFIQLIKSILEEKLKLNKKIKLLIACDGGAASGKTTAAKLISKKYNLHFLSSGLLYRYISYKLLLKKKLLNRNVFH